MAWDLAVDVENRPGALADLGDLVGAAGVNLAGGCGHPLNGRGVIHLLVEDDPDPDPVVATIEDAGLHVSERREVLVVDVRDEPGTLGSHARRLADAGLDIELFYVATGTRLVFGVDDIDRAREVL